MAPTAAPVLAKRVARLRTRHFTLSAILLQKAQSGAAARARARLFGRGCWLAIACVATAAGLLTAYPGLRGKALRVFPRAPSARAHAQERVPEINRLLAAASAGFVMTAGDSHANGFGRLPLCGAEVVRAGIDGAGTEVYASALAALTWHGGARSVALTIGTNDLLAKNRPSDPRNFARLSATSGRIIALLAARADNLVVTAIPPVHGRIAHLFDLVALERLSQALDMICAGTSRCSFTDPFSGLRSPDFGIARDGALKDDLHLADYAEAYRHLEPLLCRAGGRP